MEITIERDAYDGLYSYEIVLLAIGVVLFLVGVWAPVRRIRTSGSLLAPLGILPFVLVPFGYSIVKAVQFNNALDEAIKWANVPTGMSMLPSQKKAAEKSVAMLAAGENITQTQALAANVYRAIDDVNNAYQLAQSVLHQRSAHAQAILAHVLAAKFSRVQAYAPITETPATASVERLDKQRLIANIAKQSQATPMPLPADLHAALAKAYVFGQSRKVQANVEAARRIDSTIGVNSAVLRAVRDMQPSSSALPEG